MSDEKNLSDDLNDMLGDAKEGAKKAADKAEEAAKKFSNEAKESAREFSNDAQTVLSDGKNIAIIAHITLIGWIIALVMNNNNKTELGSFYIRQMLGLMICALVLSFIPIIGWIVSLVFLALWLISLVGALGGTMKPTPILGNYFQDWFKSI